MTMDALHRKGYCHRDLHPANVFLCFTSLKPTKAQLKDKHAALQYLENLPEEMRKKIEGGALCRGRDFHVKFIDFGVSKDNKTERTMSSAKSVAWANTPEQSRKQRGYS